MLAEAEMDNYDNFFNDIGGGERTPVYHTPDPIDPKDNKSGRKFTVITVLFVIIAIVMCIAVLANVIVLAAMKSQISQEYASTMTNAVRDEYLKAIEEYLEGKDISDDVLEQIKDDVIAALNTSAAAVAGTRTVYSTQSEKAPHPTAQASSSRQRTRTATVKDTSSPTLTSYWKCAPLRAEAGFRGEAALLPPTLSRPARTSPARSWTERQALTAWKWWR